MPAPPINLNNSGMDTQRTIQQLMQIERIPIQRMEQDNQRNTLLVKAWEEVRNRTRALADKSRILHSFAGPFATKTIESSDPGAITGEASPAVQAGRQEIEVMKLASNHQIHSDPVPDADNLNAAKFDIKIGDRNFAVQFGGGNLSALNRAIRAVAGSSIDTVMIRVDNNRSMIALRSMTSGVRGALQFNDTDGLLQKIGLLGLNRNEMKVSPINLSPENTLEYKRSESAENRGSFAIESAVSLQIQNDTSVKINVRVPEHSEISFRFLSSTALPAAAGNGPEQRTVNVGPDISVDVGGVGLRGYNIDRDIQTQAASQPPSSPPLSCGMGFIWKENDVQKSKEIDLPCSTRGEDRTIKSDEITGGKALESMYFFSAASVTMKVQDIKLKSPDPNGQFGALHVTEEASDAVLKINGIQVTRPSNTGLTDIIEGASLNLRKITTGSVTIKVKVDSAAIVAKIKEWVTAYNDLIKFCRENSEPANHSEFQSNRPTDDRSGIDQGIRMLQAQAGVFATDSTVRQLVAGVRSVTSAAYPGNTEPAFRILADIGITTGEVGSSWDDIQNGYLVIDEPKLNDALDRAPDSVRELFASDNNEDSITDNGLGFNLVRFLEPYNRLSGGLVSARIDLLKTQITDNKERIRNKEISLRSMEETLRRRFGRMENAVQQSRSTGEYLRNNMRSQSSD